MLFLLYLLVEAGRILCKITQIQNSACETPKSFPLLPYLSQPRLTKQKGTQARKQKAFLVLLHNIPKYFA